MNKENTGIQEQTLMHKDALIANIGSYVFLQLPNYIELIKVKLESVETNSAVVKIIEDVQINDICMKKGDKIGVSFEQLQVDKPKRITQKQPYDRTGKRLNNRNPRRERWGLA